MLVVADTVKATSAEAIAAFHDLGLTVTLLTGDNARTARSVGRAVNVDNVIADVLPDAVPQWTVRDGAEELRATYEAHGLTRDQLEGPSLQRIRHVQASILAGRLDETLRRVAVTTAAEVGA